MAMQVVVGIQNETEYGTEVLVDEKQRVINYTDTIKEICDGFFVEKVFTEDGEDIIYRIISSKQFAEVLQSICKIQDATFGELKKTLGNTKKDELIDILYDYTLMMSVVSKAISLAEKNNVCIMLI